MIIQEIIRYIIDNNAKVLTLVWEHFYLFSISTIIAIIIGLLISIAASDEKREKLNLTLISLTGACQAIPSVATIAIAFLFIGIGAYPSIIALTIYSLVPIIFNATSGFQSIDSKIIEAARGMGYTNMRIITKIKIPLAMPVIMAGIRSAATINIGTAAIASIIGGGGLGDLIFIGLKLDNSAILLTGAILTAFLAIVVDFSLYLLEQKLVPAGLKTQENTL